MTTLTSPPWEIKTRKVRNENNYHRVIVGNNGHYRFPIARLYTPRLYDRGSGRYPSDNEMAEIAHLIAAAPEMYEALNDARDAIALLDVGALGWEKVYQPPNSYKYPLRNELLHNIDLALAKARGERKQDNG